MLLGNAPVYLRVLHAARLAAVTDAPVLLSGERGTGKLSLAQEIHACSERRLQPLAITHCAGISEARFEAELAACFEPGGSRDEAEGPGTLFLHQVEELSAASQLRLLHFLQSDAVAVAKPQMRLLASACGDLFGAVESGEFREDLFYHLHVVPLALPPLRERSEDIMLLAKDFTAKLSRALGRKPPRYSVSSRNLLKRYFWPGNLTELRNFCQRMVILMPGKIIQPENLPLEIRQNSEQKSGLPGFVLPAEGVDLLALEGDMIRQALGMSGGNRSRAARLLRISRDTLLYRINKHAIKV